MCLEGWQQRAAVPSAYCIKVNKKISLNYIIIAQGERNKENGEREREDKTKKLPDDKLLEVGKKSHQAAGMLGNY